MKAYFLYWLRAATLGAGLNAIIVGHLMSEHGLKFHSEKNGETIDQAIKREISEMTRLLSEVHRIDDSDKRIITEGIVKYAMGFYLIMRKSDIEEYKETIGKISEYFRFMDDKYYSELEGRPDDMKELTELLNKKQI